MKGIENYNFEDKNRWRIMMWARAAGRVKRMCDTSDCLVLYLAGEQDLDRKIAVRKGFRPANLIAVDATKPVVRALRRTGVNAICGELVSVLASWTHSDVPRLIYGDFCSGLEPTPYRLGHALFELDDKDMKVGEIPRGYGFVVMFNFQRGRDAWSNDIRDEIGVAIRDNWAAQYMAARLGLDRYPAHRGRQFIFSQWFALATRKWREGEMNNEQAQRMGDAMLYGMNPEFMTYKSGVMMDSVLFYYSAVVGIYPGGAVWECYSEKLNRQIAACMAYRTRRLAA